LLDLPEPESPVEPEPLPSAQVGALRGA